MKITPETNAEISEKVRSWYEFSRNVIPSIDSRSFITFLAGSSALSLHVTPKVARYRFTIDSEAPSAYIDKEHNTIALPLWYVDPAVLRKMFGEDADLEAISLSLCNGSHIHEALHAENTPLAKLTDFFNLLAISERDFMLANQQVASTIMNVVEDIFIESLANAKLNRSVYEMIVTKNSILFLENEIREMVRKASAMTDPVEIANAQVNLFTALKNIKLRHLIENVSILRRIFSSYVAKPSAEFAGETISHGSTHSSAERAQYAYKVTRAILSGLDEEQRSKVGGGSEGDEKGDESKTDRFDGKGEKNPQSEGIKTELTKAQIEAIKSKFESATQSQLMVAKIKQEREDEMNSTSIKGMPAVEYYDDIFSLGFGTYKTVGRGTSNYSFINLLRQLRTKNHTTGPVRQSGTHLVNQRIYRIGTDGKMFNNKQVETESANKVAVVILVDASGSMGSMFSDVMAEALAMFKALRENNIPTAVYAHTSAINELSTPGLFKVVDCGIARNDTQAVERFSTAMNIRLSENYDGVIIEALNNRVFSHLPTNTKKILFVLSDGQPSGSRYNGHAAIDHTKEAIKAARKLGVFVAAISLVSSVVYNNSAIYGAEYNVDASKNLRKSFENLVIRMQEEGRL